MKRTVSIVISMMCVASALLFTSCQSDPIVGTWQLNAHRMVTYVDGVVVSDESESDLNSKYRKLWQIEFNNDGSYTEYLANEEPVNGKWDLLDDGIYYSLGNDNYINPMSEFASRYFGEDWTEYAPATYVARLIDNQTLEVQERVYPTVANEEGEGEGQWILESTELYVRIK